MTEEIYQTTFSRLVSEGEFKPNGFIAMVDEKPVGLVQYIQHRTAWSTKNNCYLQDLYADPESRSTGVGRALIETVYAKADELSIRQRIAGDPVISSLVCHYSIRLRLDGG